MNSFLRLPFLLLCAVAISVSTSSCNDEKSTENATAREIPENPFKGIAGEWIETADNRTFIENWRIADESMIGSGVMITGGDTVFRENMTIEFRDSSWVYATVVEGHNQDEEVIFKNILKEDSLFIFENREHDFPGAIAYQLRRSGVLQVKLRGTEDGEIRNEEFNFRRNRN